MPHNKFTLAARAMAIAVLSTMLVALSAVTSEASFTIFEATGADAAANTPTRDAFRGGVGG